MMSAGRLCVAGACLVLWMAGSAASDEPAPPRRHALLVACTRYPHLPERRQLQGPANDIQLFRRVLESNFGFPPDSIVELSEAAGGENTPLRAHIEREFQRLAREVRRDDQVVIVLNGHGSFQPDGDPNEDDPEPDGMDEVFCPADVGGLQANDQGVIENAILDDELYTWTQALLDRGAWVWVVLDACHSGTGLRGGDDVEVPRSLPPEELLPAETLAAVEVSARAEPAASFDAPTSSERLAVLYAAQSNEQTYERPIPRGSPTRYGIFSYALCEVLAAAPAGSLSYRDLAERVWDKYVAWGRTRPTPFADGGGLDQQVLGTGRAAPSFTLSSNEGAWTVDAGLLQGLSAGCVLAVYPPFPAPIEGQPLGHVEIDRCDALAATVHPVAYDDNPPASDLPDGGQCRPVYVDFGDLRLRVAILEADGESASALAGLKSELTARQQDERAMFRLVETSDDPQWVVQLRSGGLALLPAEFATEDDDSLPTDVPRYALVAGRAADDFVDAVQRIFRAQSLRALADASGDDVARGDSSVDVQVELLTFEDDAPDGRTVAWETGGIELAPGDRVAWRITNVDRREAVDITVLYLDSQFGLHAVFPRKVGANNRLPPGQSYTTGKATITTDTVGVEDVIVIAVRSRGPNRNFTSLAQATYEEAHRGPGGSELDSPLGRLLSYANFAEGTTRGAPAAEMQAYQIVRTSFRIRAPLRVPDDARVAASPGQLLRGLHLHEPADDAPRQTNDETPRGPAADVYPLVAPATVLIQAGSGERIGTGTGFLIDPAGWIVTNHHVVADAQVDPATGALAVSVFLGRLNGDFMELVETPLPALVYKLSEAQDLALLKLSDSADVPEDLPFLTLAERVPRPGEECIAIGHPASGALWTVRSGQIGAAGTWPRDHLDEVFRRLALASSAERELLEAAYAEVPQRKVLVTNCGIHGGDSGGALVNEQGQVVGVTFAIPNWEAVGVDAPDFGYHVHLDELVDFLEDRPEELAVFAPDPWPAAVVGGLADSDGNRVPDALVLGLERGGQPTGVLLDVDEDSLREDAPTSVDELILQRAWDFEFALHPGPEVRAFYDTENDGQIDLVLFDADGDGRADRALRLAEGAWQPEDADNRPLIDGQYFADPALRKRFKRMRP
jgi:S1-C subfamily serine protease